MPTPTVAQAATSSLPTPTVPPLRLPQTEYKRTPPLPNLSSVASPPRLEMEIIRQQQVCSSPPPSPQPPQQHSLDYTPTPNPHPAAMASANACAQEQIALLQEWRIASTDVERQVISHTSPPSAKHPHCHHAAPHRSRASPLSQFVIQRIEAEKQFLSVTNPCSCQRAHPLLHWHVFLTLLPQRLLSLSPLPANHPLMVTILDRIDILMRWVRGDSLCPPRVPVQRNPRISDLQQHQDGSPR